MSFYFKKVPSFIQKIYSKRIWMIPPDDAEGKSKTLYLTYDDGPHPDITPRLLDLLSKFQAKVTFFQLGSKAELYPSLNDACKAQGHTVANHGYMHIDAYSNKSKSILENINKGATISLSQMYRPPYGRLPPLSKRQILEKYRIVMWDIMPGDFDGKRSASQCIDTIKMNAANGSIICLHENDHTINKVIEITENILSHYTELGYTFKNITLD